MNALAWLLLALPLLSAVVIYFGLRKSQNIAALLATGSAGTTLVLTCILLFASDRSVGFDWISIEGFSIEIGLLLDSFARRMMLVVTGVGVLVHVFSLAYMKDDAAKGRYFASLSMFMFSMTGIVLASNFIMMFIFWELVGLSSYLLIGHWYQKDSAADAAKKAFLTNRIGDFGFMIGILLLWSVVGSVNFEEIALWASGTPVTDGTFLAIAVLCIFAGAMGKSAQAPLHVWLPDAMEGPTPVSALIHAATMVAAGVFMMTRLFLELEPVLVQVDPFAPTVIAWVGGITSLLAALMATQQDDIKKILAYSTLSQLGYMVMVVGLMEKEAGVFHLFTHAWFKALLFLGSGAIIYACHHRQNIWDMGGLFKKMPITAVTFLIGTLALCGFPLTAGFFSKEQVLEAAWHHNQPLFFIATGAAFLTTFYMLRLCFVVFFGKTRSKDADHAKEVGLLMFAPLVILSALAIIAGWNPIAGSLSPLHKDFHWHLGPALFASLGSFIAGAVAAFIFYWNKEKDPLASNAIAKIFKNKFYIDEFYLALVKWVQGGLATVIHFLDELFINGLLVGGLSRTTNGLGRLFTRLQSGNLQGYAGLFGLGVILIIYLTVFVS